MKTKLHLSALVVILLLITTQTISAQKIWVKDNVNNPVMDNLNSAAWDYLYYNPCVLAFEDSLSMWYRGRKSSTTQSQIGYAYSLDGGLTWVSNSNPVITLGNPGDWNKAKYPNTVLLIGDTLKMWYSATDNNWDLLSSIGSAKRHIYDNVWIINNVPQLEKGSPGDWDDAGVYGGRVIFDSVANLYKMWYHGWDVDTITPDGAIGYATSIDGNNWIKDTFNNPVIEVGPSGSFYDTWIFPGAIRFSGNIFEMWFTGWDGASTSPYYKTMEIGHATSTDGIAWNIDSATALKVGASGDWDDFQVRDPSVVLYKTKLKMFYPGGRYGKIGLAIQETIGINENEQLSGVEMIISPNPIINNATITIQLSRAVNFGFVIYNQQGQIVSTIPDEKKQIGAHEYQLDSKELPAGIYYCILKTNNGIISRKFIKK